MYSRAENSSWFSFVLFEIVSCSQGRLQNLLHSQLLIHLSSSDPSASTSQVLGLQACSTTPSVLLVLEPQALCMQGKHATIVATCPA